MQEGLAEFFARLLGVEGRVEGLSFTVAKPYVFYAGLVLTVFLALLGFYVGWRVRRRVTAYVHPLTGVASKYLRAGVKPWLGVLIVVLEALALVAVAAALAEPKAVFTVNLTLNQTIRGEFHVEARPAIVVVLDVSGSMAGAKIEAAKRAVEKILGIASRRGVDVGFIAFNEGIVTALPPGTPVGEVEEAVRELEAGGGTMYTYPLTAALNWLKPYRAFKIPVAVVFATDGLPADRGEYYWLLEEYKRLGIPVYTVFIGSMVAGIAETQYIARATGGEQYTAKTVEDIERVLAEAASKAVGHIVETSAEATITTRVEEERSLAPLLSSAAAVLVAASLLARHRYNGLPP